EEVLNRRPVNCSERKERIRPDIFSKGGSPEIFGRSHVQLFRLLSDDCSERVWKYAGSSAKEATECVDGETANTPQVALCNDQTGPRGWGFHQTVRDVLSLIKSATAREIAPSMTSDPESERRVIQDCPRRLATGEVQQW